MKKYPVYLFDFDGTIIDSISSLIYIFRNAYRASGMDIEDNEVYFLMRHPLIEGYRNHFHTEEGFPTFLAEIYKYLDDDHALKLTKIYDDTLPSLTALKSRGAILGIVTSNKKGHVKDVLNFLNVDESLFSIIVGNEETKLHKPNADPLLKGIELLGVSKNDVVYVGDALDDVQCGVNAGVDTILIDRLDEYGEKADIKTLLDLL